MLGTARLASWHAAAPARAALLAVRERRFDARYGVDTRGSLRVGGGSTYGDSFKYTGANPSVFRALVADLPADPRSLTFVDVGCGKGKTFVLAAEAGFARLVGVELRSELAAVARANLATRGIRGEITEGDAATFAFPGDPLFVFLFNPFGEGTLRAVMQELRRSYSTENRPVFVGYQNPIHREIVDAAGFVTVAEGRN